MEGLSVETVTTDQTATLSYQILTNFILLLYQSGQDSPLKYHVSFNDMKYKKNCHSFFSKVRLFSVPKIIHFNKLNKQDPSDYKKYMYDEKSETKKKNEYFVKGRITSRKPEDLQIMYTYQYFQLKYY